MDAPELAIVGLTCNLVGVFFLANSIIFRRPRRVVEEFFGLRAGGLETVKDYALNRIQVVVGFLFLNAGFLLQAFATLEQLGTRTLTLVVCLLIVVFAGVVYGVSAAYSRRSFRRYMQDFFRKHRAWSFHENMAVTKEIGLFLGTPFENDMTVEEYVHRVRKALDVPPLDSLGVPDRRRRDSGAVGSRP